MKGFTLGLGGYSGKLGKDLEATPALHTATRIDAIANYRNDHINIGGEYFQADNWNNVNTVATDSADGVSFWVSAPVSRVELFARYDLTNPSKDLNPDLKSTYYHAGVQFKPAKLLTVAVAFKHTTVDSGLGGKAAGVGSSVPGSRVRKTRSVSGLSTSGELSGLPVARGRKQEAGSERQGTWDRGARSLLLLDPLPLAPGPWPLAPHLLSAPASCSHLVTLLSPPRHAPVTVEVHNRFRTGGCSDRHGPPMTISNEYEEKMMKTTWSFKILTAIGGLALAVGLLAPATASAANISGAGATFPYPIYAKWAGAYKTKTGMGLNYQSIGSGGGIKQIEAKTVNFGASDKPLQPSEMDKYGLMQFPMIMGGVVPVVNVPGVSPGQLKLSGAVLADIYLGKITKWNDPAIARLNSGVRLPSSAITVVHRSDGSGTTFIFTHYMAQVSSDWKSKVGEDASVSWPAGVGGKGNEGVASYAQRIPGAIGYVEYAYALQNKLAYVLMQNQAGKFVAPSSETFQAAAAGADWENAPGFYLLLTNQPGEKSWPITGASFILMYEKQDNAATAKQVLEFFDWAYSNGDAMAESLDYVPMPDSVVKLVEKAWASQITDKNGRPIWTDQGGM